MIPDRQEVQEDRTKAMKERERFEIVRRSKIKSLLTRLQDLFTRNEVDEHPEHPAVGKDILLHDYSGQEELDRRTKE
jgi:hypothetical protein